MSITRIQAGRSSTALEVPTASSLKRGEIFVNTEDKLLYCKDHTDVVFQIGSKSVNNTYDNSVSGLSATDVQNALDELDAAIDSVTSASVVSFNGRDGVVVAAASDYDADQVDFDNATSGLAATDVQAAIDEVEARVDTVEASYVSSFNARTGAVTPATSDYDADQIDYDNATSGLTATEVQGALDELAAGGVGGASVSVSDNPPGSPSNGDLWWQSDAGRMKVYYNDGTSEQWVDVFPLADALFEDIITQSSGTTTIPIVARGSVAQTANLQEWQNSVGTMLARITSAGGVGGQGAYVDLTSSASVKSNVKTISDGLAMVRQMNPVSYTLDLNGQNYLGFIAEELQPVVPDAVVRNEEFAPSPLGVKLSTLTAVLTSAIKQLDQRLSALENSNGV